MKTIPLKEAYEILQNCAAVIIDDHTVTLPYVEEPIDDEAHQFLSLRWEEENQTYEVICEEGPNDNIQVAGSSMFLRDTNGEELQVTILDSKNIEPNIETVNFVPVSTLIPTKWEEFWAIMSEDSEFSWGTNNRTLVTASSFLNEIYRKFPDINEPDYDEGETENQILEDGPSQNVTYAEWKKFIESIEALGETYIDLEN